MLTLSDAAKNQIRGLIAGREAEGLAVQIKIEGKKSTHYDYYFGFIREEDRAEDAIILEYEGFRLYIDATSAPLLEGASLDFNGLNGSGFQIHNPNPVWDDSLAQEIADLIDKKVNPGIAVHGGFVTLVEVKDAVAYVIMGGGCQGCGMAGFTLRQGIEKMMKEEIPALKGLVDMTHHAGGSNPYYAEDVSGKSPLS